MEFNYMILQAYDFYKLNNDHDCILQIGGSDQWGNIVNGVELIRKLNQKDSLGLTTPLITLSTGAKMGKSEKGAIWLDENLFSSYDYWQFWRNTTDSDVERFLKFFTEIDLIELKEIIQNEKNINNLKILLANEATKILHGEKLSAESEKTAKDTFVEGNVGKNLPQITISVNEIKSGINIIDLLSTTKIIQSKSEARRVIKSNGIKVNDKIISSEKEIITQQEFKNQNFLKISFGKKKHYKIILIN